MTYDGGIFFSLTEFACEPELSPTSMYLTVPRGKNVSIVCTVTSDPVSDITWFFNGRPIDQGQYHPAVSEFISQQHMLQRMVESASLTRMWAYSQGRAIDKTETHSH